MKNPVQIAAAIFCLIASSVALAGRISGGGGMGVVCRNADDSIKSVELLDLWEARTIYNQKIIQSSDAIDTELDSALDRVKNFSDFGLESEDSSGKRTTGGDVLKDDLKGAAEMIIFGGVSTEVNGHLAPAEYQDSQNAIFRRNVNLRSTRDAFEDMTPNEPGCKIEQIVDWKDYPGAPLAEVNLDLLDHMDSTNKVALGLHESLYRYMRDSEGEANSLRVRRVVGYVMSGGSFQPLKSRLTKPYIECASAPHTSRHPDLHQEDDGSLIYFVNNPEGPTECFSQKGAIPCDQRSPGVQALVSHIRNVYGIDFITRVGFPSVKTMFSEIQNEGIDEEYLRLVPDPSESFEVETLGYLRIAKGGHATAYLKSATGGQTIAPDRDLLCRLVK